MSNLNDMNWIPEILYEENSDGSSSNIPFVMVPPGEEMPQMLYIFESSETGEFEPDSEGEEMPVMQWDLHQYADMAVLKNRLDVSTYDLVRVALGLDSLADATRKGKTITDKVRENLNSE
jgi:hypothetical protein|tara:strand:+ start:14881 stop:15240 length:360 start_codon:yes stop_codon:yes gene_type:complete